MIDRLMDCEWINNVILFRPLRGVGAVVLGAGPAHAFYFGTYEYTKEHLAKYNINDNLNYGNY